MERVIAGDFRVLKPLSEGGMGAVYVAEQLSTGKQRALKLMKSELAKDARFRDRFALEARVGSRIESEHIVEVVAAGIDNETPWLAMELLDGEDVHALVERRGALPLDEVKALFRQLGHALEQAHAAGIVHRDLKPENLFVAKSRREGVAFTLKVLDFGIAKLVSDASLTAAAATGALGTPLWMAPEQTDGRSVIGFATDIWPLGLIAYWSLTGRNYWRTSEANGTLATLMREILIEPLGPPTARAPASHLPPGFDAWFARCVARAPSDRFASAREAVNAFCALGAVDVFGATAPSNAPPAYMRSAPPAAAMPSAPPHRFGATTPAPFKRTRSRWAILVFLVVATVFIVAGLKRRMDRDNERRSDERDHGPTFDGAPDAAIPISGSEPFVGSEHPYVVAALFCDWSESCATLVEQSDRELRTSGAKAVVAIYYKDAVRENDRDGLLVAQAAHAIYEAAGAPAFIRYRDAVLAHPSERTKANIVTWATLAGMPDAATLSNRLEEGRWRSKVDTDRALADRLHVTGSQLFANCEAGYPSRYFATALRQEREAFEKDAKGGEPGWLTAYYRSRCAHEAPILFKQR